MPSADELPVCSAIRNWSAVALVFAGPLAFAAWLVMSDGHMIHAIDVAAATGPWACSCMSILGVTLSAVGLTERKAPTAQEAALWTALVLGVLQIPAFLITTAGVALGIGAPA